MRSYAWSLLESLGPIMMRRKPSDPKFTVQHVLEAIYRYFSTPLTQGELDVLYKENPAWRSALAESWNRRTGGNVSSPLVRSDLLGNYRQFEGVYPDA
ncbi:hypothetical protein VNI00_019319, partial [Paramarasmius palmivorus]